MNIVSDQIIQETVKEVSDYQKEKIDSDFLGFCKRQPDLASFFTTFVRNQRRKTIERCLFVFFVIGIVFEKSAAAALHRITYDDIERVLQKNKTLIAGIKEAHNRFYERIAEVRLSCQPDLMKYVIESLETEIDPETPFSNQEAGVLFFLFMVVIDVFSDALPSGNTTA